MRWSSNIGRIQSTDIYVHWTFIVLLLWILVGHRTHGEFTWSLLSRGAIFSGVLVSIGLHEAAHLWVASRRGIAIRDITLLPTGGVPRIERLATDPRGEIWVALAGPIASGVIALLLSWTLFYPGVTGSSPYELLLEGSPWMALFWINALLAVVNLLPALPMDGGRVLRVLLSPQMRYLPTKRTNIAVDLGQALSVVCGVAGMLLLNPALLFAALVIYIGAKFEARSVEAWTALEAIPVRVAMRREFRTLKPNATLQEAIDAFLVFPQEDFPIISDSGYVGMLRRMDIVRGMQQGARLLPVANLASAECQPVEEKEMLDTIVRYMHASGNNSVPVVRDGELVGLLTLSNIGEFLASGATT